MTNDHHRRAPGQRPVCVTIEMDNIRRKFSFDSQEPVTRPFDIRPWVLHPFQLEVAVINVQAAAAIHFAPLIRRQPPAHRREHHFVSVPQQSAGQFQRIYPNTAHRVGRHQNGFAFSCLAHGVGE